MPPAVAAKVVAAVKPVCAGVAPAGLQACLNKAAIEMQKASGMKVGADGVPPPEFPHALMQRRMLRRTPRRRMMLPR